MKKIKFFTFCLAMIMGTFNNISSANDKKVGIFYDERFLLHDTSLNHPENPERLIPVIRDIKNNDQKQYPNESFPEIQIHQYHICC